MARPQQLTAMQAKFARHYAQSHNGADAARRAGYSPRTARIAGSKALARPQVQAEVARLSANHTASAGRVLQNAVEVVNVSAGTDDSFNATATSARILEEMSEKIAEQLTRHWLISTLIRNIKIGMTDIPARQTKVRTKLKGADGSIVYESTVIEVYERDAAAVVASCKLLLDECDRREARSAEIKAAAEQSAGPSLGARLLEKAYGKLPPIVPGTRSALGSDSDPT